IYSLQMNKLSGCRAACTEKAVRKYTNRTSESARGLIALLTEFAALESQRDSVLKPRVAESARLPWVDPTKVFQPQRGCSNSAPATDATPLGLKTNSTIFPRVASPTRQPWAGGRN